MNYTFRLKDNSTLRVFYNDLFKDVENKIHGTVSWFEHFENGEHREIVRTVRIGEDERRFFTWNKEKSIWMSFWLIHLINLLKDCMMLKQESLMKICVIHF